VDAKDFAKEKKLPQDFYYFFTRPRQQKKDPTTYYIFSPQNFEANPNQAKLEALREMRDESERG
jgi:hypothetical protein